MKNNVKVQDDTQSLQSCVSVSVMDLRIGNLIYSPIQKENVTLVAIEQGNRPITLGKRGTSSFSGFDCLQPIPLNEDLISEICFNENKVMGMYRLEATDDYSISFSLDNDMIYIGDDIEIRISKTPLHKFQNIYHALTGSELQIGNLTEH